MNFLTELLGFDPEDKNEKFCTKCEKIKPINRFQKSHTWCKDCKNEYTKQEHRKVLRRIYRKTGERYNKYSITENEYNEILINQSNSCAICKRDKPGGKGNWHIDHDHIKNKVRGILCARCNLFLGVYERHRKAINDYLDVNR